MPNERTWVADSGEAAGRESGDNRAAPMAADESVVRDAAPWTAHSDAPIERSASSPRTEVITTRAAIVARRT